LLPGGRPLSLGGFISLLLVVGATEATAVSGVVAVVEKYFLLMRIVFYYSARSL